VPVTITISAPAPARPADQAGRLVMIRCWPGDALHRYTHLRRHVA
jgi:hypothetical protein